MGGEEDPGAAKEPDRGGGLLIGEGLGIDQLRETMHGRVQIGVADLRPCPFLADVAAVLLGLWARHPAPSGISPTFFTSRWTM